MASTTLERPTSTSPRSRATSRVLAAAALDSAQRRQCVRLLGEYFENVTLEQFERDLADKDHVVVLEDRDRVIRGFSTVTRVHASVRGEPASALFSGDSIVERSFRQQTEFGRTYLQHLLDEAERTRVERTFWFLISSGYRTYRVLPHLFRDCYPNRRRRTPSRVRATIDALATSRFGDRYDAQAGVIRLDAPAPLREVEQEACRRDRDPDFEFFKSVNPGHATGDELACLAELSHENLSRAGRRRLEG